MTGNDVNCSESAISYTYGWIRIMFSILCHYWVHKTKQTWAGMVQNLIIFNNPLKNVTHKVYQQRSWSFADYGWKPQTSILGHQRVKIKHAESQNICMSYLGHQGAQNQFRILITHPIGKHQVWRELSWLISFAYTQSLKWSEQSFFQIMVRNHQFQLSLHHLKENLGNVAQITSYLKTHPTSICTKF